MLGFGSSISDEAKDKFKDTEMNKNTGSYKHEDQKENYKCKV